MRAETHALPRWPTFGRRTTRRLERSAQRYLHTHSHSSKTACVHLDHKFTIHLIMRSFAHCHAPFVHSPGGSAHCRLSPPFYFYAHNVVRMAACAKPCVTLSSHSLHLAPLTRAHSRSTALQYRLCPHHSTHTISSLKSDSVREAVREVLDSDSIHLHSLCPLTHSDTHTAHCPLPTVPNVPSTRLPSSE